MQEGLDFLLDSIMVNNKMFPATASTVVGFARDNNGDFQVVTEQSIVKAERGATLEEVKDYMSNLGFRIVGTFINPVFSNDDYVLSDLHTGNAVISDEGDMFVIDSVAYINTQFQAQKGKRNISDDTIESVNDEEIKADVATNNENKRVSTYQALMNFGIKIKELYKPSETDKVLDKFDSCRV